MGKRWTEEEDTILSQNWGKIPSSEIGVLISRTESGVQSRAYKRGIRDPHAWGKDEISFLKSKWGITSASAIGRHLGRKVTGIYKKVHTLDLESGNKRAGMKSRTGGYVHCAKCGNRIYRRGSRIKPQNFCSVACMTSLHRLTDEAKRKMASCNTVSPNRKELLLDSLLQEHFSGVFLFNGNFSQGVMLGGLIPDFVNVNGHKAVIELFGDYWHNKKKKIPWKSTEFGRQAVFSQLGYKSLIVWEHELNSPQDVVEKIRRFNDG